MFIPGGTTRSGGFSFGLSFSLPRFGGTCGGVFGLITEMPGMGCGGSAILPPRFQTPCMAELRYRPVAMGINHAFWIVLDRSGGWHTVSGGPARGGLCDAGSGNLNVWVTPGSQSARFPADNAGARLHQRWFGSEHCAGVDRLLSRARTFNATYQIDYECSGPNSNTAARWLGNGGGFNPRNPPPATVGWTASMFE